VAHSSDDNNYNICRCQILSPASSTLVQVSYCRTATTEIVHRTMPRRRKQVNYKEEDDAESEWEAEEEPHSEDEAEDHDRRE
jgi:hypothetical protein